MMDALTIQRRVHEMVTTGELPCDEMAGLWARMGDGKRCAACAKVIGTRDVEYAVHLMSGKKVLLHQPCHTIWREECEPDTPSPPSAP